MQAERDHPSTLSGRLGQTRSSKTRRSAPLARTLNITRPKKRSLPSMDTSQFRFVPHYRARNHLADSSNYECTSGHFPAAGALGKWSI